MSKRRNFESLEIFLGRTLLAILAVLLVFGVLEYAYFKKNQKSAAESRLNSFISDKSHWPRPYVMASAKPSADNPLGYLGSLPALKKEPGEYRIFLLGGSTVAIPQDSIAQFLQADLRNITKRNVLVFNFGVTSSVSRQDLIRILIDIAGYSPDLVIHYGGGNEVTYGPDPRVNYPHRFFVNEVDPLLSLSSESHPLPQTLVLSSYFLRANFPGFVFNTIAGTHLYNLEKSKPADDKYRSLKTNAYLQNLRWAKYLSHSLGSDFMAVFQPLIFYKKRISDLEKYFYSPGPETERQLAWRSEILNESKRSELAEDFLDISEIFSETDETIYRDVIHVKENSTNAIIASALTGEVIKRMNSKKKYKAQLSDLIPEVEFSLDR